MARSMPRPHSAYDPVLGLPIDIDLTTTNSTAARTPWSPKRPRTMATAPPSPESYASLLARCEAAEILQSYEMLAWASLSRCEVALTFPFSPAEFFCLLRTV